MFNTKVVQPSRLDPETKFRFRCHKDVPCFTLCCSNIDIMLTPYDVLRLKKALGMTSEEFLDKHVYIREDEQSSHPYAYLIMGEGEDRTCPFLKSSTEGCGIYEDRPICCRYYPIGQATLKKALSSMDTGEAMHEEFWFFVREDHCKGYAESTEWTVKSWRDDQGAEHYDEMNREWKELLMRRDLPGQPKLDAKKREQFFMASYDLDRFRRFVFDSKFLDMFDVPQDEVTAMREDDVALMKFAFKYIKFIMMMENTLKLKAGITPPKPEK